MPSSDKIVSKLLDYLVWITCSVAVLVTVGVVYEWVKWDVFR